MVCSTEFFVKTLPRIVDDRVSLVLTPQAYHNYDPATDIFNHSAFAYWSMLVPGEDAWGHIVCTGTSSSKSRDKVCCFLFSGVVFHVNDNALETCVCSMHAAVSSVSNDYVDSWRSCTRAHCVHRYFYQHTQRQCVNFFAIGYHVGVETCVCSMHAAGLITEI